MTFGQGGDHHCLALWQSHRGKEGFELGVGLQRFGNSMRGAAGNRKQR